MLIQSDNQKHNRRKKKRLEVKNPLFSWIAKRTMSDRSIHSEAQKQSASSCDGDTLNFLLLYGEMRENVVYLYPFLFCFFPLDRKRWMDNSSLERPLDIDVAVYLIACGVTEHENMSVFLFLCGEIAGRQPGKKGTRLPPPPFASHILAIYALRVSTILIMNVTTLECVCASVTSE